MPGPGFVLRPLRRADARDWERVRLRSHQWLTEWEATAPPEEARVHHTFASVIAGLRRQARQGRSLPFVIEVDGEFVGQVTVSHVVRGSAQMASIGYWIAHDHAGRGIVTEAVRMVIDHCFTAVRLHRIEICVRPENDRSLRVVEKLGLPEVGFAPRLLYIAGAWRDHRVFAVTREDWPLRSHESHK